MSDDPAHDRIAAIIKAVADLVVQPPTVVGFDFADLREGLADKGPAVFGQGKASGENRAIHAADLALADIRRQLRRDNKPEPSPSTPFSGPTLAAGAGCAGQDAVRRRG